MLFEEQEKVPMLCKDMGYVQVPTRAGLGLETSQLQCVCRDYTPCSGLVVT